MHPLRTVTNGSGTGVRLEWEFADFVLDIFGLQFVFGCSDPGHFRVCVNNRGNSGIIDMSGSRSYDVLNAGNAVFLSLMCQHWAWNAVANSPNGRNIGVEFMIHHDESSFVRLDTNFLRTFQGR